jgi:hypothetical protein
MGVLSIYYSILSNDAKAVITNSLLYILIQKASFIFASQKPPTQVGSLILLAIDLLISIKK